MKKKPIDARKVTGKREVKKTLKADPKPEKMSKKEKKARLDNDKEMDLSKHKIESLLQEGRQRGFVTEAEILEVIPETEEQIELIEEIYK